MVKDSGDSSDSSAYEDSENEETSSDSLEEGSEIEDVKEASRTFSIKSKTLNDETSDNESYFGVSDSDEEDSEVSESVQENEDSKSLPESSDAESVTKESDFKTDFKSSSPTEDSEEENDAPPTVDEYEEDTSDEEDIRNTVGNIPMKWYDDFPHIGYTVAGEKLMKPATNDEIDEFLDKIDDPNYWRTVKNKMTGEKVLLNDEELNLIRKIQMGKCVTEVDPYQPFEDIFSYKVMEHPVTNHPPHKRSFIPSKIEKEKVSKLVYAIKMGWIKPRAPKEKKPDFYMMWDKESDESSKRMQRYIPAPKRKLPSHEESYNPPPEYLFNKDEEDQWKEQDPDERKLDFIPRKHHSLLSVPSYPTYIKEWLERCLDLYLCPRQRKMKVQVDPNDLLPELPKPKDLQPFPTVQSLVYTGHSEKVRCICVEMSGQFLASGSDDHTVRIWEVLTGRCMHIINVNGAVTNMAWCPNQEICVLLVAVGQNVYIINPNVGDKSVIANTNLLLSSLLPQKDTKGTCWVMPNAEQKDSGIELVIAHAKEVKQVVWQTKGDYFATLAPQAVSKCVTIHQLSKCRTESLFSKFKSEVQCILFHPHRPFFFVATKTHVKVYNLLKRELTKKILTNCSWISSMAIHPKGDNLLIGSYDCRVSWFDLDLSSKPFKELKHHKKAVRQVAFHKHYPLFASASQDGSVIICHGSVYNDLLKDPLIVPVKVLKPRDHKNVSGILDCCFHPQRPWIFATGHDSTVRLFT